MEDQEWPHAYCRQNAALPYAVFNNKFGVECLYRLLWRLAEGCPPSFGFNDLLVFFIPKSNDTDDLIRVSWAPNRTRQIGLRNTGAKIL